MTSPLLQAYRALLASGAAQPDPAQAGAVAALDALGIALAAYRPDSVLSMIGFGGAAPKGLYLHGKVGRGKSMLMDLFFTHAPVRAKRRLHFDAFMTEAHAAIEAARATGNGDPMPGAAKALAAKSQADRGLMLCLDEFQVNDIADAMILSRLFTPLFARGLVLVTTSNTAPNNLYRDGLNRQLFLPFVDVLKQHTNVLELAAARDYRLEKLMGQRLYFTPLNAAARSSLEGTWRMLTGGAPPVPKALDVAGRNLSLPRACGGAAWLGFDELCARPLGAADYRAVAAAFHTVILEGIPTLGPEKRNEARRFITLIDALYDARTHLIASAEAEPDALYPAGDGSEAFQRTASRLMEMRSRDYLEAPRPPALPLMAASD